jgi:hypothetical protein
MKIDDFIGDHSFSGISTTDPPNKAKITPPNLGELQRIVHRILHSSFLGFVQPKMRDDEDSDMIQSVLSNQHNTAIWSKGIGKRLLLIWLPPEAGANMFYLTAKIHQDNLCEKQMLQKNGSYGFKVAKPHSLHLYIDNFRCILQKSPKTFDQRIRKRFTKNN